MSADIAKIRSESRWAKYFRALNASSVNTIPAYGLVRVVSIAADGTITVDQPNAAGQDCYVNSFRPIQPSGYGAVSKQFPLDVLYETADGVPAQGDTWGAGNATYKLRKNNSGFTVEGGVASGTVRVKLTAGGTGGSVEVKTTNPGTGDTAKDQVGVTILQIDQASGLDEAIVSGTTVTVKAQDGNYTHKGVLNLTTDQFLGAGRKSVDSLRLPVTPGDSSAAQAMLYADITAVFAGTGTSDYGVRIDGGLVSWARIFIGTVEFVNPALVGGQHGGYAWQVDNVGGPNVYALQLHYKPPFAGQGPYIAAAWVGAGDPFPPSWGTRVNNPSFCVNGNIDAAAFNFLDGASFFPGITANIPNTFNSIIVKGGVIVGWA